MAELIQITDQSLGLFEPLFDEASQRTFLTDPDILAVGAVDQKEACGLMLLKVQNLTMILTRIVVAPEHRRRGIGRQLLVYAKNLARKNDHILFAPFYAESEEDDLYLLFRTDPALSLEKTGEGVYRAPISSLSKILERLPAKSGKYQVEPLSALSEGEMKAVVKKCEEEGAGYFDPYDRDYLAPLCLCARKNKTVESMLLTKRGNREDELFLAYVYSRSPMALADVMKKAISVALTLPEEIRFFRFVSIDATAKNIADKLLPEAESAGSTYMAMLDR